MRKVNYWKISFFFVSVLLSVVSFLYFKNGSPFLSTYNDTTNLTEAGCISNSRKSILDLGGSIDNFNSSFLFAKLYGEDVIVSCIIKSRVINIATIARKPAGFATAKIIFDVYKGYEEKEKEDSPIVNRSLFASTSWNSFDLGKFSSYCSSSAKSTAEALNYKIIKQTELWLSASAPDGSSLQVFCLPGNEKALIVNSTLLSRDAAVPLDFFIKRFSENINLETPLAADQFTNNIATSFVSWSGNFQYSRCQITAKNVLKSYKIVPLEVNGGFAFEKDLNTVFFLCSPNGNSASFFLAAAKKPLSERKVINDVLQSLQSRIK